MSVAHELSPSLLPVEQPEGDADSFLHLHGAVNVHGAVSRYTLSVPTGELASDEVIDYMNGFGAFKKTMRGIRDATASEGIASISSSPIRRSTRTRHEDLFDATKLHVDTHAAILEDVASHPDLRRVPNGKRLQFERVNLGAHSYGGEIAVKYALENPGQVENIVFIKPVGLEDPRVGRYIPRLPGFLQHELLPFFRHIGPNLSYWDAKHSVVHFFADPYQTMGEMYACVRSDNRRQLLDLTAQHIGLAVLTGEADHLIPAAPIEELAAHLVDYYEKLPTDHLGPQKYPQIVAQAVIRSLARLEEIKPPSTPLSVIMGDQYSA